MEKYLRNILIGVLLLQALASAGLFYSFLYQAENIISTQNIYVTKEVALNYINPIKPNTYKTQIGQFISSHKFDFEVNPNNKIPFKNYKDVIDHLPNQINKPPTPIKLLQLIIYNSPNSIRFI